MFRSHTPLPSSFFLCIALVLLAVFHSCSASPSWDQDQSGLPSTDSPDSPFLKNTYFVEFHEGGSAQSISEREQHDDGVHHQFEAFLADHHKIPFKRRYIFTDPRIVLGISVELTDPDHSSLLNEFHAVKAVHRVRKVHQPRWPHRSTSASSSSISPRSDGHPFERAMDTNNDSRAVSPTLGNNTTKYTVQVSPTSFEPYRMIGADRVHADGHFGKGQKIAVIDSGIDPTHHAMNGGQPDGKACFGPGCPISGGFSFVDDAGNEVNSTNPFANCLEGWHGTFTSGLLIANAPDRNFTGIVPQAQIAMYRVFSCHPQDTGDDLIMAAMQKAYHDGADVMSISIGRTDGWHGSLPVDQMATRLSDLGMHMVISVGNLGRFGAFQAESPSNTPRVISVSSVQNNVLQGYTARIKSSQIDREVVYYAANPLAYNETSVFDIYATSSELDPSMDACKPLPASVSNLTKSAVLIKQSIDPTCRPYNQRNTAMAKDARVILSYGSNTNPISAAGESNGHGIQLVGLSHEDGIFIKHALRTGSKVSIDFSHPQPANVVDKQFGGYGIGDGTSYSTPLVAGAIALYRSIKGSKDSPLELRKILTTTAVPALWDKVNGVVDSVARQGAGVINIHNAIHSTSRASQDHFALNDTRHLNGTQQVTITNVGTAVQHFKMQHQPAGTVHALDGSPGYYFRKGPLDAQNGQHATLQLTPQTFSLAAGASQTVTIKFFPPAPDQRNLPIISGFARAVSDQPYGSLSVPYLGIAADLSAYSIFETQQPPGLYDSNSKRIIEDGRIFTLADGDLPELRYWILLGTRREFTVLVHANTSYVPTVATDPKNPRAGRGTTNSPRALATEDYVATLDDSPYLDRSLGQPNIPDYGSSIVNRTWTDSKGATHPIQDGDYRMLVRLLRLNSDPSQERSYDSYLSPMFRVRQKKNSTSTPHPPRRWS
ncbi:hypothetical protein A4X09_0g1896 [Tilletia walkeri]|uniref:Subtilisin-like protease n=1 Tax=Tilletia walkeri TaxID=117179 RepID=A0A8X7T7L7_9BASI|nr:hypothetical protein A4X09_0g1896 [Tilletia walkeri]